MPHCQNCGAKWSWADTLKVAFNNNKICASCGERQYVAPDNKIKTYALAMTPIVILIVLTNYLDFPMPVFIALTLFCLIFTASISPFTIKLSNDQQPLW